MMTTREEMQWEVDRIHKQHNRFLGMAAEERIMGRPWLVERFVGAAHNAEQNLLMAQRALDFAPVGMQTVVIEKDAKMIEAWRANELANRDAWWRLSPNYYGLG